MMSVLETGLKRFTQYIMHRTYFCFGYFCILTMSARKSLSLTLTSPIFIIGALESFVLRFPSHPLIIFRMSQVDILLHSSSVVFLFHFITMEITGSNEFLLW